MSTSSDSISTHNQTPAPTGVAFARTDEGLLVAKVGDNAFAMAPGPNGRFFLASAWRLRGPMEEWKRSDFYGHGGDLEDETAFRTRVAENVEHQRQCAALTRRGIASRASTPWGASQHAAIYVDGVICYSTASHGGFHLDAGHNAKVYPALRARGGWYEEDCAWAAVAQAFPELFTDYERRCADRTIRDWYPDAWEAIHEKRLEPGEPHEKDRRTFLRDHASDWIVDRAAPEQRRYLVPSDQYHVGRFGFVIDEARHRLYDGPSSLIGWNR